MELLEKITELSHEFGTSCYVCGGGGNTSVKNTDTIWVKPSGTTLAGITAESFVAIDRSKLHRIYEIEPPSESSQRETLVKDVMMNARISDSSGRPSVEAPLHDSLQACYVVHTHPAIINGMTCSKEGRSVCQRLFPEALWLDYIDPGYTLCMKVRTEIQNYKQQNNREPSLIFLKNHGIFVSADEPEEIHKLYNGVLSKLKNEYESKNISQVLDVKDLPAIETVNSAKETILSAFEGIDDITVSFSGFFNPARGPISPDHIVYAKSYPFIGEPSYQTLFDFQQKNGYWPRIIVFNDTVFGIEKTEKKASLALDLSQDGALVIQLADAFGGIEFMTVRAREFIENWEVESYRSKQL